MLKNVNISIVDNQLIFEKYSAVLFQLVALIPSYTEKDNPLKGVVDKFSKKQSFKFVLDFLVTHQYNIPDIENLKVKKFKNINIEVVLSKRKIDGLYLFVIPIIIIRKKNIMRLF